MAPKEHMGRLEQVTVEIADKGAPMLVLQVLRMATLESLETRDHVVADQFFHFLLMLKEEDD